MKKLWAISVLIAVITAMFFLPRANSPRTEHSLSQNGRVSENSSIVVVGRTNPQPGPSVSATDAVPNMTAATDLASRAASPDPLPGSIAGTNEPPALPPLTVLDKARVVIHNYHAAFGENPVGTNPEIAAALQGKNPKQINFLAESGLRLNDKGEIIDGYGTPFFFHQISGQEMEIRSAGPDRVMWSSDDLVTK
jgi:hypothetical protein